MTEVTVEAMTTEDAYAAGRKYAAEAVLGAGARFLTASPPWPTPEHGEAWTRGWQDYWRGQHEREARALRGLYSKRVVDAVREHGYIDISTGETDDLWRQEVLHPVVTALRACGWQVESP